MSKVNSKANIPTQRTYEGGKATKITPTQELRRAVCASMLFEDSFYETGVDAAKRMLDLSKVVPSSDIESIIVEAKFKGKLRHTPLFLAANTIEKISRQVLSSLFTRPDDITDFIALYWKDGKKPLKKKIKKAINAALNTYDAYQLAKYKGSKTDAIKMVDVFNLTRPKPIDSIHEILFKKLMTGTLEAPDTWEVALSSGANKKVTFERLMQEKTLGGMAFFRNIRNMLEAGINESIIINYMSTLKTDRLMPINLYAAGRIMSEYSIKIQAAIEDKLIKMLSDRPKLKGKTAIVVDTSGSMFGNMVGKSKMERIDYALALTTILQGVCEDSQVIFFNTQAKVVKGKTGFALHKAASEYKGGTDHASGLRLVDTDVDRVVMITDEQTTSNERFNFPKAYILSLAGYKNSIAYKPWVSISGFSDKMIDFIFEYENNFE